MMIGIGSIIQDELNNRYVLDEFLGKGGFGAVYKAHNTNDSSCVAVKIFNSFSDPDSLLSFKKETNLFRLISSEYVVKYLYVHDGQHFPEFPCYIIMEYCNNGTLRDLINNRNDRHLSNEEIKKVFLQLAQAMKCVNDQLIHRDIKPENILNFNGALKITDFGLSKIIGESTKTLTFKNCGTKLYIAPEAWDNSNNTIQMDIYSMGIVFYEVATLKYPYSLPRNDSYSDFKNMHLLETPVNPQIHNTDLQPNLASVIIKMLEKPTQSRFGNWDEIINMLESDAVQHDKLSKIVNDTISTRNERDLLLIQQTATKQKEKTGKQQQIDFIYSQYVNTVLNNIKEFANLFNSKYPDHNCIKIVESKPSGYRNAFCTNVFIRGGQDITITGEILFKDMFTKKVKYDTQERLYEEEYIPQIDGKDILLWCQLKDNNSFGFNLILVKNESDIYGKWKILENKLADLVMLDRPSPFGFELTELPKQIEYVNVRVQHIYEMSYLDYSEEKIDEFIKQRI